MFSALYCDTYVYQYPFSKEQLSIALKEKFPQGFFDDFYASDSIIYDNKFTIKFSGRSISKIRAHILPTENSVSITVTYKAYTGIYLLFSLSFLAYIASIGESIVFIIFIIVFGIGYAIEYNHKNNLKIHFEERLGLPTNDDMIERTFKWF
jgi:hypothetical protein